MERSPLFYETVWAAAYAAAYAERGPVGASLAANQAVDDLSRLEENAQHSIARREEMFHEIRARSAK